MTEDRGIPQESGLDVSEQEQIRREKLQGLQAAGKNPYDITRFDVTHTRKFSNNLKPGRSRRHLKPCPLPAV